MPAVCPDCRRMRQRTDERCPWCGAPAYALAEALMLPRVQLPETTETPLVDHDVALRRLRAAWRSARRGQGHLVSLVGETGSGRSRLVREFDAIIVRQAPERLWLGGQAYSYATYRPYGLLADLLAPWSGATVGGTIGTRLAAALERLAVEPGTESAERQALAALAHTFRTASDLGVIPIDRVVALVTAVLRRVVRARPVVVALEDLEWGDAASHAVLDSLLPALVEEAALVICTHHADWSHDWPDVRQQSFLLLGHLSRSESRVLIEYIARSAAEGGCILSATALQTLVAAGDGNPLLIEQVTHAVCEGTFASDDPSLTTDPLTPHEVIHARIASLPVGARDLLVAAAVIGLEFSRREVVAATGQLAGALLTQSLDDLGRRGMIRRWRDEPEIRYRFTHPLIQEIAYDSLLPAERQALEGRIDTRRGGSSASRSARTFVLPHETSVNPPEGD